MLSKLTAEKVDIASNAALYRGHFTNPDPNSLKAREIFGEIGSDPDPSKLRKDKEHYIRLNGLYDIVYPEGQANEKTKSGKSRPIYTCPIPDCTTKRRQKVFLTDHVCADHFGVRPYVCGSDSCGETQCEETFRAPSELFRHKNPRQCRACDQCGKMMISSSIRVHKNTHNPSRSGRSVKNTPIRRKQQNKKPQGKAGPTATPFNELKTPPRMLDPQDAIQPRNDGFLWK